MKRLVCGLGALLASTVGLAATGHSAFNVNITLARDSGLCVSESLSAGIGATVQVVCQSGQFVDISPTPGKPFAGVHGGAYRFHLGFGSGYGPSSDAADPFVGAGTVTALRVYHTDGNDGPLEMLVSF